MEWKQGMVVRSLCGRDKDTLLCVVAADGKYVYVCDGKERPLERAKRKNPKHISVTPYVLSPQDLQSNRAVKQALKKIPEA